MQPRLGSSIVAALSAAALFLTATPAEAQGLVSIGSGSYTAPATASTSYVSYCVRDRGNGAADGYALWMFSITQTAVLVHVTSWGFYELPHGAGTTTALAFAGQIVATCGNPDPNLVVGRTTFSAFADNGRGVADETIGFSVAPLPSQVPPVPGIGDLTTIQQIALLLPFFPTPVWAPFERGNVWIR